MRGAAAPARVSLLADLREGWRFVRRHSWLWATFASAAIAYLLLHGAGRGAAAATWSSTSSAARATDLGIVFAAGGLGSVAAPSCSAQRGLPRRDITFMYVAWTLATLAVAGYGARERRVAADAGQPVFNALETAGHDRVGDGEAAPRARRVLGRVVEPRLADLDRAAAALLRAHRAGERGAIGAQATLVGAAVVGAVVTFGALWLPGMRVKEGAPPREHELVATMPLPRRGLTPLIG